MTIRNEVQWNSGVEMNGVHCPVCGVDCYNTWGLIEHMKSHLKKNELGQPKSVADIQMSDWICSQCGADCGSRIGYIMHVATCNGGKGVEEEMPWEVFLDELEAKPGLWFDEQVDEPDELEFLGATLDSLRMSGTGGNPQGRIDPLMQDIADERFELAFVTGNSWI